MASKNSTQAPRYDFPVITVTGIYNQCLANIHTYKMVGDSYVKIRRDAISSTYFLEECGSTDNLAKRLTKGNLNIPSHSIPEEGCYALKSTGENSGVWELIPLDEYLEELALNEQLDRDDSLIENKLKDLGYEIFTASSFKVKEDYSAVIIIFQRESLTYTFLNMESYDVDELMKRYAYATKAGRGLLVDLEKQVAFDMKTMETFKF